MREKLGRLRWIKDAGTALVFDASSETEATTPVTEQIFLTLAGLVFGGFAVALVYAHANTVNREARIVARDEKH